MFQYLLHNVLISNTQCLIQELESNLSICIQTVLCDSQQQGYMHVIETIYVYCTPVILSCFLSLPVK